jgi:hypothetical protein
VGAESDGKGVTVYHARTYDEAGLSCELSHMGHPATGVTLYKLTVTPSKMVQWKPPPVAAKKPKKVTLHALRLKYARAQPISMLTAYDYPTARLADGAGADMLLVGDSLGMVVLGREDTTDVTMDEMVHHCKAACRGTQRALVVGDLPFGSCITPVRARAATAVEERRLATAHPWHRSPPRPAPPFPSPPHPSPSTLNADGGLP